MTVCRLSRFLLLPLLCLAGCGHKPADSAHAEKTAAADEELSQVRLTDAAVRRHKIRVEKIARQELHATLVSPARVTFNTDRHAHVGAMVKGRAIEIKVEVGDAIDKGAELMVIESPELGEAQSDYLQRRIAVEVATAAQEPAKLALDRAKNLNEQNQGVSLAEVQKRQAEYTSMQGNMQIVSAAERGARNKLRLMGMENDAISELDKTGEINQRYVVRSPIAGHVIDRDTTLGELVSPDKEALAIVANLETLWVVADVSEARQSEIVIGAPARIEITALPGQTFQGRVTAIAPVLDTATRSVRVRIAADNPQLSLRPGMFAKVEIDVAGQGQGPQLALPEEAVQTVGGQPAVFVPLEGEANTFVKQNVKVGKPVGAMIPILSGLEEGQLVVVSSSFILKADLEKGAETGEED